MNYSEIYLLITVMFLGMMTPGPDFILIVSNSRLGLNAALKTSFGIWIGFTFLAIFSYLGAQRIFISFPEIYNIIVILSSCYLIYLSFKILSSIKKISPLNLEIQKETKNLKNSNYILHGFLTAFLNPKLILFLFSLYTQFNTQSKLQMTIILSVQCLIGWVIFSYIIRVKFFQNLLSSSQFLINLIFSICLLIISLKLLFTLF